MSLEPVDLPEDRVVVRATSEAESKHSQALEGPESVYAHRRAEVRDGLGAIGLLGLLVAVTLPLILRWRRTGLHSCRRVKDGNIWERQKIPWGGKKPRKRGN